MSRKIGGGAGGAHYLEGGDSSCSIISKDNYHRPRRPDPDTIHYLRSLPLDVTVAHDEIHTYLRQQQQKQRQKGKGRHEQEEEVVEYPSSLIACLSVIDEIKNEIASLAGDEYGAMGIETLARIALPYSELTARKLLYYTCCSPSTTESYTVHLALHRYGSHVLQTLLSLCICNHNNNNSNDDDLALHPDGPGMAFITPQEDIIPTLSELLLQIQQDLSSYATQLSVHMCGSHVLRALLCALGGVQMIDTRSGALKAGGGGVDFMDQQQQQQHGGKTNKKKKKKSEGAAAAVAGGSGGSSSSDSMQMFFVINSRIPSPQKDVNIRQALLQLTHAITGSDTNNNNNNNMEQVKPPGELQQRACHASAAPVLIMLLRVLTYVDANAEWKNKLLLPSTSSTTTSSSTSFANHHLCLLRQEPQFEYGSAAHALAKQLLCWCDDDVNHNDNNDDKNNTKKIGGKWASDVIYGLSGEPRGSHVLDALFRLSPDDFYQSILQAGDFYSSSTLKEYIEHDVSNFVVQTLLATIRNTHQAETMVQALAPIVSSGLVIHVVKRRRGILWRLAEMAANHNVGQVQVMQCLQDGLKAVAIQQEATTSSAEGKSNSNSSILEDCTARVLLDMKRPDTTETGRLGLNVEGTRALYHLLRFKPRLCKPVVNSIILALSPSDLELLAKDGLGSRCIWDAFLEWPATTKNTMQAKVLRKLLDKLHGRWVSLATDRIGHHVVRKVFRCLGDMNDRENLVKELVKGIQRLRGNAMGRTILEACAVEEYGGGGGAAEWRKIIKKKMEKEEWLEEIVHKSSSSNSADDAGDGAGTPSMNEKKRHHSESETSKRPKNSKGESAVTVDSIMEAMSIPASAKKKTKKKKS